MKVYFIRHAETEATKQGLVQGSADFVNNQATIEGIEKVRKTAYKLADELKGTNKKNIHIYSSNQMRCIQTTSIVGAILDQNGLLDENNVVFDDRMNGRSYGSLENLSEKLVRTPAYMLKHPKHAISYVLANMGFDNASRIEPKKKYADRIFATVYEMVMQHEGSEDVVIISSTSDMFNVMQSDHDIHSMCYFGYEQAPDLYYENKIVQPEQIKTGEFKTIEMGKPSYLKSEQRYVPLWEVDAVRDYYKTKGQSERNM